MLRRAFIGFLLLLVLALGLSATAIGQERKIERVAYVRPALSLAADATVVTACAGDGSQAVVHLDARAMVSNPVRFSWRVTGGDIAGEGPTVTWDLAGLEPGYYKAFVEIATGSSEEICQAFSSTTVLVACSPPPTCPNVSIACPDHIGVDEPLVFSANLAGGSSSIAATYNWTVSAGRIIEGQGTTSITVDTRGLAGQIVRAEFSVVGYSRDCSTSCAVQIPLPKVDCRKFDEFPAIARDDEKARLDNFAVELRNDPTATAYIIVYPGTRSRSGDAQRHTSRVVDYLVNSRALDTGRIVTIAGPTRNELMVELRICPRGAVLPKPAR